MNQKTINAIAAFLKEQIPEAPTHPRNITNEEIERIKENAKAQCRPWGILMEEIRNANPGYQLEIPITGGTIRMTPLYEMNELYKEAERQIELIWAEAKILEYG